MKKEKIKSTVNDLDSSVLNAIEKALQELVEKCQGVGKVSLELSERGQERNTAQLERIGAMIEWR